MVSGGFAYGYLFMSQHKDTPEVFQKFLARVRPSRILEIGTFHGGLTLCLRDIMDNLNLYDSPIVTYDVNDQEFLKPLVKNKNIVVVTENIFSSDYSSFKDDYTEQSIRNFIQGSGVTVVLCDGGCKKCEFNLMSSLLKINDVIMAHDYAPNIDYFEKYIKNKIWDWLEIQDNDINESIKKYNLNSYHQALMQKIAWCSKIKS
jgi:hypothetical protein